MKLNKKLLTIIIAATAAMTFVGCSSNEQPVENESSVDATIEEEVAEGELVKTQSSGMYAKIVEGVELPALIPMDETMVTDIYGIDMSMLSDFTVMGPMMSVHITEIGVFNVTDEANVDVVKAAVEARLEALKNGGAFYPEQIEVVNKGQVVTKGNFVLLVADSAVEQIVENFNAAE